jgi:general secretion pathway protein L
MMLSNQAYFRDIVAIIGRAWHWWVGELAETLKLLARIRNLNIIDFEVLQSHGLALSNSNGIKNIRGRQNIALKFNDNAILYRKLRLPATARKDIDKVVGYEFDKYFPMDADNAFMSCEVIEPDTGAESIEVEIRAIAKAVVESHLRTLREQYAIEVKNLYLTNSNDEVLITADMSKSNRTNGDRKRVVSQRMLNVMIGSLLVALFIYPLLKLDWRLSKLEQEVAALETEAQPIIEIREKILGMEKRFQYLIDKKKKNPDQAYLWSRVSQSIVDQAILKRMEINERKVRLEGRTASVERMINSFETDSEVSEVKIIGSVSTSEDNQYENMKISLTIDN